MIGASPNDKKKKKLFFCSLSQCLFLVSLLYCVYLILSKFFQAFPSFFLLQAASRSRVMLTNLSAIFVQSTMIAYCWCRFRDPITLERKCGTRERSIYPGVYGKSVDGWVSRQNFSKYLTFGGCCLLAGSQRPRDSAKDCSLKR